MVEVLWFIRGRDTSVQVGIMIIGYSQGLKYFSSDRARDSEARVGVEILQYRHW